jgi:GGDEF domain-containing protein
VCMSMDVASAGLRPRVDRGSTSSRRNRPRVTPGSWRRCGSSCSARVHMRLVLGPLPVSVGVACFSQRGGSPERLPAMADSAPYRAKAEGRNRVAISSA